MSVKIKIFFSCANFTNPLDSGFMNHKLRISCLVQALDWIKAKEATPLSCNRTVQDSVSILGQLGLGTGVLTLLTQTFPYFS